MALQLTALPCINLEQEVKSLRAGNEAGEGRGWRAAGAGEAGVLLQVEEKQPCITLDRSFEQCNAASECS